MPKQSDQDNKDTELNETLPQEDPELISHDSYEILLQKLEDAEEKAQGCLERLLRTQADHENAIRRAKQDAVNAEKDALKAFATELLPIIDSLELCLANENEATGSGIVEGVNLTLKMFYKAIEKFGIQQVNPIKEVFDPEFQQAISMEENAKAKPGTVVSVLQKGYTLNGRLLRPALVSVAK